MMKEKNLVYIAGKVHPEENIPTDKTFYEERLWEFLISLRYLANYQGEIVYFDYDSDPLILERVAGDFGVDIIPLEVGENYGVGIEHNLSNRRNIDAIPHLEQNYKDYKFLAYDLDVWFQDPIDEIWTELDEIEGLYYSVEKRRSCRYRGPQIKEIENEYQDIQKRLEGFVWGGLQCGKYKPYIERLKLIADLFINGGWLIDDTATDQSLITYTVDFDIDKLDAYRWGFEWYHVELKDNRLVSMMDWYTGPVSVIHVNASLNRGKSEHLRFKHLHPDLWKKYHKKLVTSKGKSFWK